MSNKFSLFQLDTKKMLTIYGWFPDRIFFLVKIMYIGDKKRFDKEQIGVKEPFPVTKC